MASQLWSSFNRGRAESLEPNPSLQANELTLEIAMLRAKRPAQAPPEALTYSAKRLHNEAAGLDRLERIRLLKIWLELTKQVGSPAQNLHPPFAHPTVDQYQLRYLRALIEAKLNAPCISPVYSVAEEAGFPVAVAGPRGPIPDLMNPDRFQIPGFEDPSGFALGPSITTMRELPSSLRRESSSDLLETYLKNKSFNGELTRNSGEMMMAINGSDFSGPNIGKGKAVDGGTTSNFGGKGEWGSSSSGLQIIEKMEDAIAAKKGKSVANYRRSCPKEYEFFPVKEGSSSGGGGGTPAPVPAAKTSVGEVVASPASARARAPAPIDLTLKLSL